MEEQLITFGASIIPAPIALLSVQWALVSDIHLRALSSAEANRCT